ncbi:hypothetical protein SDC9_162748 [bioreactor metagenome]|uniref:Uncharacterized protein n=1 Tax=bioreactor metagenome TaxID=1076179 RepID=A0A645FNY1_9ZZZZ
MFIAQYVQACLISVYSREKAGSIIENRSKRIAIGLLDKAPVRTMSIEIPQQGVNDIYSPKLIDRFGNLRQFGVLLEHSHHISV